MPDLETAIWEVIAAVLPGSQHNMARQSLYIALTDFADAIQRDVEARMETALKGRDA